MNRLSMITSVAVFFALSGCAIQQDNILADRADGTVLLTIVSDPAPEAIAINGAPAEHPQTFRLGAGDALGHSIFTNYVAYVRANRIEDVQYATGAVKE